MSSSDTINDVTIRTAGMNDLDVAAELFLGYLSFYGRTVTTAEARDFLADRLRAGQSVILLADVDGRTGGFLQVYPTFSSVSMGPVWTLNDLFVTDRARRRGVGRALIRHTIALAREAGVLSVQLETAPDNHSAQALYLDEGFSRGEYLSFHVAVSPR